MAVKDWISWVKDHRPVFEASAKRRADAARRDGRETGRREAQAEWSSEREAIERKVSELADIKYRLDQSEKYERVRIQVEFDPLMLMGEIGRDKEMLAQWVAHSVERELRQTHVLQKAHEQHRNDEGSRWTGGYQWRP